MRPWQSRPTRSSRPWCRKGVPTRSRAAALMAPRCSGVKTFVVSGGTIDSVCLLEVLDEGLPFEASRVAVELTHLPGVVAAFDNRELIGDGDRQRQLFVQLEFFRPVRERFDFALAAGVIARRPDHLAFDITDRRRG